MKELVRRAKAGDAEAFVELIESQKQSFYKIARTYFREQMDIDDAISETVLACWEKLGTLRHCGAFRPWAVRILINKCNDILAQRRQAADVPESQLCDNCPDDRFGELVDALEEPTRTIFVLFYAEGFKIREIADILDMSEGTVSSRLSRGREQLRRLMEVD